MKMSCLICCALIQLCVTSLVEAQFRLDITKLSEVTESIWDASTEAAGDKRIAANRILVNVGALNNGRSRRTAKDLREQLHAEVTLLAVEYQLTREQQQRIFLAGQMDLAEWSRIGSVRIDPGRPIQVNQLLGRVQRAQKAVEAGILADNTMAAKVAQRILSDATLSNRHQDRVHYAYQSSLRLIVTELDLVAPLDDAQRKAIDAWIDDAQLSREMAREDTYAHALQTLSTAKPIQESLRLEQREQLRGMLRHIQTGAVKPSGIFRSRRSLAGKLKVKGK